MMVLLLPITVPIALLRLLVRSLARVMLAVPAAIGPAAIPRTFLWVVGVTLGLRLLCFRQVSWVTRMWALEWYWRQVQVLVYPRVLDGVWGQQLNAYGPGHWGAIIGCYGLVIATW